MCSHARIEIESKYEVDSMDQCRCDLGCGRSFFLGGLDPRLVECMAGHSCILVRLVCDPICAGCPHSNPMATSIGDNDNLVAGRVVAKRYLDSCIIECLGAGDCQDGSCCLGGRAFELGSAVAVVAALF